MGRLNQQVQKLHCVAFICKTIGMPFSSQLSLQQINFCFQAAEWNPWLHFEVESLQTTWRHCKGIQLKHYHDVVTFFKEMLLSPNSNTAPLLSTVKRTVCVVTGMSRKNCWHKLSYVRSSPNQEFSGKVFARFLPTKLIITSFSIFHLFYPIIFQDLSERIGRLSAEFQKGYLF